MAPVNNAMDLFKLLPQTNCRDCRELTCLAFAAAVFRGEKRLEACPHLDPAVVRDVELPQAPGRVLEQEVARLYKQLRQEVQTIDFPSSAGRLGAVPSDGMLVIRSLGKDFRVDSTGNVMSECHVHGWVTIPLLNYVINCEGKEPTGNWVPLREIKGASTWSRLFAQRCEKPLKHVADRYTDLFEHMIHVFSAKRAPAAFDSDIAVVLHPFPKVPVLLCYWKPDDGLESTLNIFFDETAEVNLPAESLYRVTAGMIIMFEKIADTHGG